MLYYQRVCRPETPVWKNSHLERHKSLMLNVGASHNDMHPNPTWNSNNWAPNHDTMPHNSSTRMLVCFPNPFMPFLHFSNWGNICPVLWKQSVYHAQVSLISWSIADSVRKRLADVLLCNKTCTVNILFYSVFFGSCALCARPCKCGGAFTQHSVLKRKQTNETLRDQRDGAGQRTN